MIKDVYICNKMNFVFETNQGTLESDAFLMYGNILEMIMDNLL